IDTDIRLAMTAAMRRHMAENPSHFDPRDFLKPARQAAQKICQDRFQAFGCSGQASKIKSISMVDMAARYQKGQLSQIVQ
ncbi:MAG: class II fructose-bisphosphate aldolase, partial [Burkholderiaceae bacterium]|nr:class II fructose-bisphosphate aldolase [Burkholderiaceae bacterium]